MSLPVVIDIGTGYGNPLNVQRTVSEIEATGAAGVFFEDQTWPKKCGHMSGRSLISKEEMAMKVRAAVDVRENDDFVVIARTDALATEGFEAAIGRLMPMVMRGPTLVSSTLWNQWSSSSEHPGTVLTR